MNNFGDIYSKYYDLLYNDKDYDKETDYIDSLIKHHSPETCTLLDLGCGTGRHAKVFCEKGYKVHGVDLSEKMLEQARLFHKENNKYLSFTQADITEFSLNQKFDAAVSLFHVISYLLTNRELEGAFNSIKNHLNDDGIFLFDFWYGPGVLNDQPAVRVKRVEDNEYKIRRIAEPYINWQQNIVDVNYEILAINKKSKTLTELKKQHRMRFFFDTELESISQKTGFQIIAKHKWLTNSEPDSQTWYALWILKK